MISVKCSRNKFINRMPEGTSHVSLSFLISFIYRYAQLLLIN